MQTSESTFVQLTSMPAGRPGFEAFHGKDSNLYRWEYHCHDHYELYFHVSGGQKFGLDNDVYAMNRNEFILLPPFCMHGLACEGPMRSYERAYLNLTPELLNTLSCNQIDLEAFFRSYTGSGKHIFQMSDEESSVCVSIISSLQAMPETIDSLARYQACAGIIRILSIVCFVMSRTESVTATAVTNNVMQSVLTYINNNYTQPIRMDDVSHRFGISVSYLSHEFTKYTGRSVYDYVLYRRVMLAKEMIPSAQSLNAIAYQCGFNDYSNFLRSFNKLVGMSPREYRERHK